MTTVALKAVIESDVAPSGTFTVPYTSQAQADFQSGSTASLTVYAREYTDLAVTFGASEATVTWPSDADYDLPAGQYWVTLDLVGGSRLSDLDPDSILQAENVTDLTDSSGGTTDGTLAAVTDTSATDQSGPINDNFAELAAKLTEATDALKAAGLMAPDP